jgi:hypothetical protein
VVGLGLFSPFLKVFQKNLDVGPADIPGMDFMTRSAVSGYQVRGFFASLPLMIKTD